MRAPDDDARCCCRYWHRSLNVKKLVDIEFSRVQPRMTLNRTIRLHKLPDVRPGGAGVPECRVLPLTCCVARVRVLLQTTATPGFRPMTEADVPAVKGLMHEYLKKYVCARRVGWGCVCDPGATPTHAHTHTWSTGPTMPLVMA